MTPKAQITKAKTDERVHIEGKHFCASKETIRSVLHGEVERNLTRIPGVSGLIPGLHQWVRGLAGVAVSCAVGHRCGLALMWLWLWLWPAAVALI